ncbi:hypothetical protein O6H91_06G129900 [Diphasiastrum complanatum]|uniref:Uncharacterized protein n=1 Tax=Diphasiastrum complanatum TaxID=34168 RepID=A0ACC2DIQ8_DIPCM|nr:hypothetical protein O6H91_06G129900 [Diphasiastrum complanatum]
MEFLGSNFDLDRKRNSTLGLNGNLIWDGLMGRIGSGLRFRLFRSRLKSDRIRCRNSVWVEMLKGVISSPFSNRMFLKIHKPTISDSKFVVNCLKDIMVNINFQEMELRSAMEAFDEKRKLKVT